MIALSHVSRIHPWCADNFFFKYDLYFYFGGGFPYLQKQTIEPFICERAVAEHHLVFSPNLLLFQALLSRPE